MSSQQEDWHPNSKSKTQQEDLPQKEDSLWKCFPSRKTDTQIANQKPNRKTCPRKKTHYENGFPTGRLTPKQQIKNPTGRPAPERRLIKKTSSQQEDRHPNRKSLTQQKDLPQKEHFLRKCLPNRATDTQTANQKNNRKTCPRKKLGRLTPKQEIPNPTERPAPERRLIKNMSSKQED